MIWEQSRLIPMSDPATDLHLHAHADRLRALENETAAFRRPVSEDGLDGIREYSRAWHENRTTAYLLQKSWADPLNRWFTVAVVIIIAIGWTYLFSQ
jgi:hypothetical protein